LYFLIDNYSICQPSKLTSYDLKNFDKCKSLKKDGITKENINKSLDRILSLNMPYAGITVESFIMNSKSYEKIIKINNKLIDLLLNGILPMNDLNVYHNDIKDSNILIDASNVNEMKVRLIDWNLSVEYIPFKNSPFPKNWRNRPLQFNNPFSNILFTDMFYSTYSTYLKKNNS
jgi:serine/threonine protein kinase